MIRVAESKDILLSYKNGKMIAIVVITESHTHIHTQSLTYTKNLNPITIHPGNTP